MGRGGEDRGGRGGRAMHRGAKGIAVLVLFAVSAATAEALGPENLLVLVNRKAAGDLAIANHYRLRRGIPDRNFLYLDYQGDRAAVDFETFDKEIRQPAIEYVKRSGLEGVVSTWVTTPSFPYQVGENSLSAAIFFGKEQKLKDQPELGPGGFREGNAYEDSMRAFEPPARGAPPRYLHMSLDAGSVDATIQLIDRSAGADGTRPAGVVYLLDGIGPRESRKISIPLAKRMLSLLSIPAEHVVGGGEILDKRSVLGVYVGNIVFPVDRNYFVPGALGDHLTSLGAAMADSKGQMLAREFLAGGCSATYGTVVEPFNYPQKFPTAKLYVYYALGFTAVESYWMSVYWPQQGLFLGDPLTRPFADLPKIEFQTPPAGVEVKGDYELKAAAYMDVPYPTAGVRRIALYVDGRRISDHELTGVPADADLALQLGGKWVQYKTKEKEDLESLARNLGKALEESGPIPSRAFPGELILLMDPGKQSAAKLQSGASSPMISVQFATLNPVPGRPRPISTTWYLHGRCQPGDEVSVEILEKGEAKVTETYRAERALPAGGFAQELAVHFTAKLPKGYQTTSQQVNAESDTAAIHLVADSVKVFDHPSARLVLRRTGTSTIRFTDEGKTVGLLDPSLEAYDAAWLHLGVGEKAVAVKAKIPTQKLADGRHVVRLAAVQGYAHASSSSAEMEIVVRNGAGRLAVESVAKEVSLAPGAVKVAKAELSEVADSAVEFRVDDIPAATSAAGPHELSIDPTDWGVGRHRITARTKTADGRWIYSDQAVELTIQPDTKG